jgi:type II secretory pathway predicted ATPase ExeA
MQVQSPHFIHQPFEDTVDTSFFFAGGGRREVVDEIKSALLGGISLIILIGPAGSGKTMICRMVEKELPAGLISVFMPRAVESFSDMVDIVGREVIGDTAVREGGSTGEMLQTIADSLRTRGQRLVLVFEEAEKIYLATLERIRKMLDRVNADGLLLHLVLSGRPALSESLEQLGIVAFQEVEERNLLLDDLDQDATQAYLDQSLRIAADSQDRAVPADIGAGIYAVSLGNFRTINQLAAEYLQSEQREEPFLVLLDTMNAANSRRAGSRERRSRAAPGMPRVDLDFLTLPKIGARWLWTGGALTIVVVALFFLLLRSPDEGGRQADQSSVPVIELRAVEPLAGEPAVSPTGPEPVEEKKMSGEADPATVSSGSDVQQAEHRTATAQQRFPASVGDQPAVSPLMIEPPAGAEDGDEGAVSAVEPADRVPDDRVADENRTVVSAAADGDESPDADVPPGENDLVAITEAEVIEESVSTDPAPISPVPGAAAEAATERPAIAATEFKKVPAPVQAGTDEQRPKSTATEAPAEPAVEPEIDSSRQTIPEAENDDPVEVAEQEIRSAPTEKKAVIQPLPVTIIDEGKKETTASATVKTDLSSESSAEPVPSPNPEPAANDPVQAADSQWRLPETADVPAAGMLSPGPDVLVRESLYKERLAAGARWLVGGGSGRFTVQLMVLTSEQAEENLQQMLEDNEYRSVADDLFVLRRLGDPPTVMLYFGEYRTFAAAQQARNTLPVFLRKHDPYPIAVNAAVEKTRMLP